MYKIYNGTGTPVSAMLRPVVDGVAVGTIRVKERSIWTHKCVGYSYSLVMTNIANWKITMLLRTVNHLFLWAIYTMAMLNNQRVYHIAMFIDCNSQ